MDDFRKFLNKQLEDPAFRKEWEEMEPEYQPEFCFNNYGI